jgi:uncharacterized protein with HEPN domain
VTTERQYLDYVRDMVEACDRIERFVDGQSLESFKESDEKIFAVIRGLEILDEAAKQIPESVRQEYPQIPWRQMSGMRDILIHPYFGVDPERIWITVNRDIPQVRPQLEHMMETLSGK